MYNRVSVNSVDYPEFLKRFSLNIIKESRQSSLSKSVAQSCRSNAASKLSDSSLNHEDAASLTRRVVGKHIVSSFHAQLFAAVLEDVLTELRILGECNNAITNYKLQFDMQKWRKEKFGVESVEIEDKLTIASINVDCEAHKLQKLIADRLKCLTVLSDTYLKLALDRSYEALVKNRISCENSVDFYLYLLDDAGKNKETYRDLRRQLRQHRNRTKSSVYETNLRMDKLISKFEDASLQRNCRERYIDKWQKSRTEQNTMTIKQKESKGSNDILHYRIKVDEEQQIHNEIQAYISISISDTLTQIDICMNKYDQDIEAMDFKIATIKVEYEKQAEQRLAMGQKLAARGAEIVRWVQFKTEREKLRAYQEKMAWAAIVVQAWWRGILVRLRLGPFKPAMHKKNKKKKK